MQSGAARVAVLSGESFGGGHAAGGVADIPVRIVELRTRDGARLIQRLADTAEAVISQIGDAAAAGVARRVDNKVKVS